MRTVLKILTGAALIAACTVFAQTESVEGILKELGAATAPRPTPPAAAVVDLESPVAAVPDLEPPVAAVVDLESPVAAVVDRGQDEIPEAMIEALDVPADAIPAWPDLRPS